MKVTRVIIPIAALLCGSAAPVLPSDGIIPVSIPATESVPLAPAETRTVRICVEKYWDADVSMCIQPIPLRKSVQEVEEYADRELSLFIYSDVAYVAEICELMPGTNAIPRTLAERKRYCTLRAPGGNK